MEGEGVKFLIAIVSIAAIVTGIAVSGFPLGSVNWWDHYGKRGIFDKHPWLIWAYEVSPRLVGMRADSGCEQMSEPEDIQFVFSKRPVVTATNGYWIVTFENLATNTPDILNTNMSYSPDGQRMEGIPPARIHRDEQGRVIFPTRTNATNQDRQQEKGGGK